MPNIIVVLGMHRSGTSALAGLLAASGAQCGQPLLPANDGNPRGYWELAPFVALNDRLLDCLHRVWFDASPLEGGWQDAPEIRGLEDVAADLLRGQFGRSELAMLKDPRLCLTLPFWRRVILGLGYRLTLAVIARPVGEVVRSIQARDALSARDIAYLWARSMLESARACFDDRAVTFTYDQLLHSPPKVLARIAVTLDVPLALDSDTEFIDASLQNHRMRDTTEIPQPLARLCDELYAAFAEAAALGVSVGSARFLQSEAALDALDRTLLPQVQQQALWNARLQRTRVIEEIDAARTNIATLVAEVDAARQTINAQSLEIADARQAHLDRDRIEDQLRARIAEFENDTDRSVAGKRGSAIGD